MNQHFVASPCNLASDTVLPALKKFVLDNCDELDWILTESGAYEQRDDLRVLVEEVHDDAVDVECALTVLDCIRSALTDLPMHKPLDERQTRPDLDACIRWIGARLDELLAGDDFT